MFDDCKQWWYNSRAWKWLRLICVVGWNNSAACVSARTTKKNRKCCWSKCKGNMQREGDVQEGRKRACIQQDSMQEGGTFWASNSLDQFCLFNVKRFWCCRRPVSIPVIPAKGPLIIIVGILGVMWNTCFLFRLLFWDLSSRLCLVVLFFAYVFGFISEIERFLLNIRFRDGFGKSRLRTFVDVALRAASTLKKMIFVSI